MRLISSARAYAIASQWGSFNDNQDPGRCLYGFHYGDGRPVSDQHRSDCLLYLRGVLNQGGPGAMSVRSERELRSLIRFLANSPIRPADCASAMVALPVQQQQGRHVPGSLNHYRADRAYLLRSIRALRAAGDLEGMKDEQDDLRIVRQGFAGVRHAPPVMVPQQAQQQQARAGRREAIGRAYVRTYSDSGQVRAYVEWVDAAGRHAGRTEGDADSSHMQALFARAEREGLTVGRESW